MIKTVIVGGFFLAAWLIFMSSVTYQLYETQKFVLGSQTQFVADNKVNEKAIDDLKSQLSKLEGRAYVMEQQILYNQNFECVAPIVIPNKD